MSPSIFEARSRSLNVSESERVAWSRALIGFAGAVGALGGVGINLALRQSYLSSHSATSAFWIFLAFYALASVVTWSMYVRRPVSAPVAVAESVADLARPWRLSCRVGAPGQQRRCPAHAGRHVRAMTR